MFNEMMACSGGSGGDVSNMTALIPNMTSDTAPSGETLYSTFYSGWNPYYAFGSAFKNYAVWIPALNNTTGQYIGYKFPTAQTVEFATLAIIRQADTIDVKVILQGSNDSTWASPTDLSDEITIDTSIGEVIIPVTKNKGAYQYYRFFSSTGFECRSGANSYIGVKSAQLYGVS